MNAYDHEERLDGGLDKRVLRAGLGVAATGIFLVGYLVTPVWIFALSALSIYLTISAILGKGVADVFKGEAFRSAALPVSKAVRAPAAGPAGYRKAA